MSSMILQMLYIMKWRDCFDTHWLDCCASLCSDLFKPSFDKNIFEHLECELSIEYLLDILSVLSISQCRYIRILIWDYFLYHTMMLWMVKFLHNFERELGGELLCISNISPAHICEKLWPFHGNTTQNSTATVGENGMYTNRVQNTNKKFVRQKMTYNL